MATRVLGRGEGAKRYRARGSVMFFKALAEQDGGDFSLMERTLPPAGRRPPAAGPAGSDRTGTLATADPASSSRHATSWPASRVRCPTYAMGCSTTLE